MATMTARTVMKRQGWSLVGVSDIAGEQAIARWVAARSKPALSYEGVVFVARASNRTGDRPGVEVNLALAGFLITRQHEGGEFLVRRWTGFAEVDGSRMVAMGVALSQAMAKAEASLESATSRRYRPSF
jgi:hypothetical protein